jgi:outer membrane immunogenic protein
VTGGLAVTKRNFTQFFFDPAGASFAETASFSKTQAGWTIGGGYEYALGSNWTAKAEYLFADFAGASAAEPISDNRFGTVAAFSNSLSHLDVHIVRAGFNYQFH